MYAIKPLEGRGLGLIAARDIAAGDTIIAEEPLLLTVAQEAKDAACAHCLRLLQHGATACERCRQVAFCSPACAAAAAAKPWVHADATCSAYAHLPAAPLDDEGRTALRFLIQAMALRALAAQDPADGRYRELLSLDGEPDDAAMQQAAQLQPLLAAAIGDASCLGVAPAEVAALLKKEGANSYGIMAPHGPAGERTLRGGGVYPRCSRINHECAPNAARFDAFDGPAAASSSSARGGGGACGASSSGGCQALASGSGYPPNTVVSIRAMHALPAGTEIVQSYFPLNWDLRERQEQARQVYGFECRCPRCLTEAAPGWRDATGGGSSGSGSDWETDDGMEEEGEEEEEEAEEEAAAEPAQAGAAAQHEAGGGGAGAASASGQQQGRQGRQGGGDGGGGGCEGDGEGRGALDPTYLQLFLLKYMCPREACFGTMAAVPGAAACECNVCGCVRSEAEFLAELER